MAFNNDRRGSGGGNRGQYGGNYGGRPAGPPPPPKPAEPKALPEDYVTLAENTVQKLEQDRSGKFLLTTSKIRSILAMVSEVYNVESVSAAAELSPDSVAKLRRIQVRLVYEAGREKAVKDLVNKAELLSYLKGIGSSREAFLRYAGYLEALTAYHRFYGGNS